MTYEESASIIEKYGEAIAKGNIKHLIDLPCSKARIKQAYFTYLPELYKREGGFYKDIVTPLVSCYEQLNAFIPEDEALKLEKIQDKVDAGKKNGIYILSDEETKTYHDYMIGALRNGELFDEINEFISEVIINNR